MFILFLVNFFQSQQLFKVLSNKKGSIKKNDLHSIKIDRKEYYEQNKEKIKQLNKKWRLRNREYDIIRKQEYRTKNRELIKAKDKLRLLNNPEITRKRQNKWRSDNRAIMRTYGMIQHYRIKQKALALQYLQNDAYSPSSDNPFHSVPTWPLSCLLLLQKVLKSNQHSQINILS